MDLSSMETDAMDLPVIKEEAPDPPPPPLSAAAAADAMAAANRGRTAAEQQQKGAFWPERPTKADPSLAAAGVKANTVLTNLQRGNIPTMQTIVLEPVVVTLHQRAGMGELKAAELHPGMLGERDPRGRTPLMWSAFYGQTPTVSLLLSHGADPEARGDEDETALHLAATGGHHDTVKTLLRGGGGGKQGACVDAQDENACTPLMFAAMRNHPHAVNELLLHGADLAATNINGDTALALAIKGASSQAQAVIEQHLINILKGASESSTSRG